MRSGMLTGLLIALLVAGVSLAYWEHGRGNLHKIEQHLKTPGEEAAAPPRPGGQDPIVLTRARVPGGVMPEFLSATLLPGRGMDVLQISAYLPAKGEVNLLASTDVAGAARAMSGVDDDTTGAANLTLGGTFLSPWAGRLAGLTSTDGKNSIVTWHGQVLNLPATTTETPSPVAYGGLLLNTPSKSVAVNPMPDGGSAIATFTSETSAERWPSKTETKVGILLSSRSLEMTVDVKNIGDSTTPVGIGWSPRFLIPGGDRTKVMLHIPAAMRSEVRDVKTGLPSGVLLPVAGTPYDYNGRNGAALGNITLNDTFVHLKAPLDLPPIVELRDPDAKYGLRITALSATIKAIHVFSPSGSDFVSISPQMNYDDALGREWPAREDTGMVQLAPGQTVEWKIRLELFAMTNASSVPL